MDRSGAWHHVDVIDDSGLVPVSDILDDSFRVSPLPESHTPLEAVLLVKTLDEEGAPSWAFRVTPGLNDEEMLGALVIRTELCRQELVSLFTDDE